ncbi:MAG: aspartate aminotransferase family protein [archaeon]
MDKIVSESKKCRVETGSFPIALKSGDGCYFFDTEGKKYLDFNSNFSTNNVGYGRPEIKRVIEEHAKSGLYKIDGTTYYTDEALKLAKKLLGISPENMSKVLFINSGAEAVENAIKFVYLKRRGGQPGISCKGAFHGRTLGALTYTESKAVQKQYFPQLPSHVIEFCTSDDDKQIGELEEYIRMEGAPAFVIVEAVQGEGGYRPAGKKFLQTIRKVTRENNIPLIIDEVQSGMGRTGKWWAHEHYGIKPDIMTAAKSLCVGATLVSKKYDNNEPGSIGSTWGGGHLIDLAVGLKVIEIIEKEKLMKNAERMGTYFLKRLGELAEKYPIKDVRGLGLMIGFDLQKEGDNKKVVNEALKNGLALLTCGYKGIRIAPPLIITEEDAEKGLGILEESLKAVSAV